MNNLTKLVNYLREKGRSDIKLNSKIINLAKENRVYLLLLRKRLKEGFSRSHFIHDHKLALKRLSLFRRTIKYISILMQRNKIEYLVIKSNTSFDLPSDIDIIVKKEDYLKLCNLLKNDGWSVIEVEKFKADCKKQGFIDLDIHTSITYNSITFLDSYGMFKTKIKSKIKNSFVFIPHPVYEFMIIFSHAIFESNQFNLRDLLYLLELYEKMSPDDLKKIQKIAKQFSWKELADQYYLFFIEFKYMLDSGSNLNLNLPQAVSFLKLFIFYTKLLIHSKIDIFTFFRAIINIIKVKRVLILKKIPYYSPWYN